MPYSIDEFSVPQELTEEYFVKINEGIILDIEAEASCGYIWMPATDNYENIKIEILDCCEKNSAIDGVIGSPIIQRFQIKATKPGNYEVMFHYGRPWLKVIEKFLKVKINAK